MKISSIIDLILKSTKPEFVNQKIIAIDGCGGAGKSPFVVYNILSVCND